MTNEFSYLFSPVPTSQNDYQCFGNMDDSVTAIWLSEFYHNFIVVSYKSIQSKTTVFGLLLQTLSLVQVK